MASERMEIAEHATYLEDANGDPQYFVRWKGRVFVSDDTADLVDQVLAHEKKTEEN